MSDRDQQTTRVHTHCRRCQIPLTRRTAHCIGRGCPWCSSCRRLDGTSR